MATEQASLLIWVGENRPLGTLGATQNLSPSWQIQFLFGYTSAILISYRFRVPSPEDGLARSLFWLLYLSLATTRAEGWRVNYKA